MRVKFEITTNLFLLSLLMIHPLVLEVHFKRTVALRGEHVMAMVERIGKCEALAFHHYKTLKLSSPTFSVFTL